MQDHILELVLLIIFLNDSILVWSFLKTSIEDKTMDMMHENTAKVHMYFYLVYLGAKVGGMEIRRFILLHL